MVFAGTETGYSSGIYKCDSGTASSIYKPSIYEGWAKFTNSASSCDAWIEIEDTYGDCINYGTAATTIKYSQWGDCGITNTIKIKYRNAASTWYECGTFRPVVKPGDRLREIIQARQAPMILVSRTPLMTPKDIREIRARETLCRVIGEDKFQRFLKDGFVSVRAKSGLVYQIFPGHGITNVYKEGDHIERLCVVLRGEFPPTDSLIMRYLIILNDENRFRGYAIKHQVIAKKPQIVADERSLTEIFRDLKKKVA